MMERHDLLYYATLDELATVAVPVLREGLDEGEAVILVCPADSSALITAQLDHHERILVLLQEEVYRRPASAVATCTRAAHQALAAGARRVRLLSEIDFEAHPDDRAEWMRYEAIVNRAFAPLPISALCAYNTDGLPSQILSTIAMTHPSVLSIDGRVGNGHYIEPDAYLRAAGSEPADPIEAGVPVLETVGVTEFAALRHDVQAALAASGHTGRSADDLVLAVHEMVTNAARHGCPPVEVRLWSTPDRSVCTVTDHGDGFDDPFAGYLETQVTASGGRGLWLARQLCDGVRIGRTPVGAGFTVRLRMRH